MSVDGVLVVARQELRLRVCAGRWRWLLAAFFAVLVLFTALLRAGLSNLPAEDLPFKGLDAPVHAVFILSLIHI